MPSLSERRFEQHSVEQDIDLLPIGSGVVVLKYTHGSRGGVADKDSTVWRLRERQRLYPYPTAVSLSSTYIHMNVYLIVQ